MKLLKRPSLALLVFFLISMATYAQSISRAKVRTVESTTEISTTNDLILTTRAIAALKRLEDDVVIYHSLGDFEAGGKLARVSLETFHNDLQTAAGEVESAISRIRDERLKTELSNALASYRDGAFWWRKIDQPRVVNVSMLAAMNFTHTSADEALLSTVPYTVVIHWRQASKYLRRAEDTLLRK